MLEIKTEKYCVSGTEAPKSADMVSVVRCRDCRYSYECTWPTWPDVPDDYLDCTGELVELWDYNSDQPKMNPVPPDGYCYWGERKE